MANVVEFRLDGGDAMFVRLIAVGKDTRRAAMQGLYREGEAVMTRSKRDFVPVDHGVLRNSGHVQVDEQSLEVKLTYGGAAEAYALAVHEHPSEYSPPSWKNPTFLRGDKSLIPQATALAAQAGATVVAGVRFHPAGHGPKYLERPLREAQDGFASRVAARIKALTGM